MTAHQQKILVTEKPRLITRRKTLIGAGAQFLVPKRKAIIGGGAALLASTVPALAAIAFNNALSLTGVSSSTTLSQSYTVGSGPSRILFAFLYGGSPGDFITAGTVTYAGANMTQLQANFAANGFRWIYIYSLLAPASGSNTFSITASGGTPDFMGGCLLDYSGVLGVNSSLSAGQTTNSTTFTAAKNSTNNNAWVVASAISNNGNLSLQSATPSGIGRSTATGSFFAMDSNGPLSPALTNCSFTVLASLTGQWGMQLVSFDPGTQPTGGDAPLAMTGVGP